MYLLTAQYKCQYHIKLWLHEIVVALKTHIKDEHMEVC